MPPRRTGMHKKEAKIWPEIGQNQGIDSLKSYTNRKVWLNICKCWLYLIYGKLTKYRVIQWKLIGYVDKVLSYQMESFDSSSTYIELSKDERSNDRLHNLCVSC